MRPARASSLLGKLALAAGVFVVAFLLAEGGDRVLLAIRGEPHDPWQALSEMRRRADLSRSFLGPLDTHDRPHNEDPSLGILHPYFGSELEHDTGRVLEHFRNGIPKDEYTVVIVGGSVAASFAVSVGESFSALLEEDPRLAGRKVRTLNYAHPGFKQPQQLMRVAWLTSLGYRPDAVINLDGFNEVALALDNAATGTNPAFPSFPEWGVLVQDRGALDPEDLDLTMEYWGVRKSAEKLLERAVAWKLYRSSLLTRFVQTRMDGFNRRRADLQARIVARQEHPRTTEAMQRQLHGPPFTGTEDEILERCAATWFQCSRALDALCARMGTRYLHVLQPTFGDAGSKPLTEKEKAIRFPTPAWEKGSREGYPLLREGGRKLAQDGIAFVDASRVFEHVEEDLYFDACHYVARGNEILSGTVAQAFRDQVLPH